MNCLKQKGGKKNTTNLGVWVILYYNDISNFYHGVASGKIMSFISNLTLIFKMLRRSVSPHLQCTTMTLVY